MKTAPLGEIADIVSGATPKTGVAEYWDGDVRWVTPADLSKLDGPYISETPRTLTAAGVKSCATTILPAGAVLLSSRAPIGHVAINTVPMATNQGFKSLVPRANLDAKYLYHWLGSKTDYLQSLGNGATFKELSKKTTEQITIPLPPLVEQRRIAAILDHADALRAKRRQVLTHLDALGSAVFVERFGSHAELLPLGESLTFVTSGGRGWAKYYSAEGDRFIQSLDVQMGSISPRDPVFVVPPDNAEARRTRTAPGDVLLTITGSRIGRAAALPAALAGSFISQHVAILRSDPRVMLPEFLAAMLALPSLGQHLIARAQYGQTKPGLNFEQIRGFSLPRPPLPDQHRFVNDLHRIASQRVTMTRAESSIADLFASLRSRAFRGEL